MDTVPLNVSFKMDNLPLMNLFIIIVDVVVLLALGLKSHGLSKITEGDVIVLAVVCLFTLGILVADVYCLVVKVISSKVKMGICLIKTKTEVGTDFKCAICLESSNDGLVTVKCGHAFHEKCICDCLESSSMLQMTCPLCRSPLQQTWMTMFRYKALHVLNWRQWVWVENNHSKAPVSMV